MDALEIAPPIAFPALGSTAVLAVTDSSARADARALLEDELAAIDHACSRFRNDSELVRVNAAAGGWVAVSPLFLEAMHAAVRAAVVTDGRVDPTIGRALAIVGYDRDFADVDVDGPPIRVRLRSVPGWQCVEIDEDHRRVRIPNGVALDFGATAKALAADRAAARIAGVTDCGVLVSLGGDCAAAGRAPHGGWIIRLADRHDESRDGAGPAIALVSGGLATSGTTARRWRRGGEDMHHVIDPATGIPATEVWRTVSVAAASCVDANIASTAAIVLGDEAPAWLADRGLAARLVAVDGGIRTVAGWPTSAV